MSVYRLPEEDLNIPVPKEDKVVEPLLATVKYWAAVEEPTTKIGRVWEELEAKTTRLAWGVEELMLNS